MCGTSVDDAMATLIGWERLTEPRLRVDGS
jgi:hypothetical protein